MGSTGTREPAGPPGVVCHQCDYDLRGLDVDGHCPECGFSIRVSIDEAVRREPEHSRLLIVAFALFVLIAVAAVITDVRGGGQHNTAVLGLVGAPVTMLAAFASQYIDGYRPFSWRALGLFQLGMLIIAIALVSGRSLI